MSNRIGTMSTDRCPRCRARVMVNALGNRWCSKDECDYHIRDGKQVNPIVVMELNRKHRV